MERSFEVVSYVGAQPLLFGMTQAQAEVVVGIPLESSLNQRGEHNAQYDSFSIRYSPKGGTLVEIGFSNSARVLFRGIDVFADPEAFPKLVGHDSNPYEYFGFIILLDLGITLTGFHDNDESQRALTAFVRGRWDHLKGKFKDFA
jgi:hypothetical protein